MRGPGSARAVSDGFTWAKIGAAVDADGMGNDRPTAPPLPGGIGDTWFADGDGESVAFGQLGSNEQRIVRVEGGWTSNVAGDLVAVSESDGSGGAVLRLWSASRGEPVADLAALRGMTQIPAWVDGTHEQVVYLSLTALRTLDIHLVGFDGTGDRVVASSGALNDLQGVLALDDSSFVLHWCPVAGDCIRTVVDLGTGVVTGIPYGRGSFCQLGGLADGHLAGMAAPCEGRLSVEALDGSGRVEVGGGAGQAAMIDGPEGARLVVLDVGETESVLWSYAPDGSDKREVTRFEHPGFANPYLSRVRIPVPGWVLMAADLSDAPTEFTDSPTPELVNIVTGERIPLPNLPGPE
ncbi:MAG TPA: hypothetical protein VFY23_14935 [Candidatus Limnocylindrales bacterium]|nr:hypothetical protein [Candidatus Limnocylindrales bacterium]